MTTLSNDTPSLGTINKGGLLIAVRNVAKIFKLRRETVHALKGVNLEVFRGEYMSIMGPSGSGKSTLFNIIGALDHPSEGEVSIGPLKLTQLSSRQLAFVRCHYIGYIFQAYNLIYSLTALRNVALPSIFAGASDAEAEDAAKKVLELVGLGHRMDHRPGELSGGQQQRVAIARALVNDPAIILADEPTANLDFKTGADIIALLKKLTIEQGVTVITATHDHKMLANSDRVLWIRDGQVEKIQKREDLQIEVGSVTTDDGAVHH